MRGVTPRIKYKHENEWINGERYTGPVFFHYGFWDETMEDFGKDVLFGMARSIRECYGKVKAPPADGLTASGALK